MAVCTIFGYIKDVQSNRVGGVSVFIKKANANNTVVSRPINEKKVATSEDADGDNGLGFVEFDVEQGSRVWLWGQFFIGSTNFFERKGGVPLDIPYSSSVLLDSFGTQLDTTVRSVFGEEPLGDVDGSNQDFELANTPADGTLRVSINGQRGKENVDYTVDGTTITTITVLQVGDWIMADYEVVATGRLYHQQLTPVPDGSEDLFTLPSTPRNANDAGYKNGFRLAKGVDYNISGPYISFVIAPETGDILEWDYD